MGPVALAETPAISPPPPSSPPSRPPVVKKLPLQHYPLLLFTHFIWQSSASGIRVSRKIHEFGTIRFIVPLIKMDILHRNLATKYFFLNCTKIKDGKWRTRRDDGECLERFDSWHEQSHLRSEPILPASEYRNFGISSRLICGGTLW